MLMLSAYYVLLAKYTGQDTIVVGSPIVGRDFADTYNLIGMFVNTIALRSRAEGEKKLSVLMEEIRENSVGAIDNQNYPFGELVKKLTTKSFGRYLREKRCDQAAKLLAESDMPIGDIIRQVGYNNESFFRSVFAEFYGTTPYNYRKKKKQGVNNHD